MNKPDRRGIVFVAAVLCLGALAAAGPDAPPPLIRRDLLRKEAPVFPKIVRDPFSTVVFIVDSGESGEPSDLTGKELSPAETPPPPPPPVVRYIGFARYAAPGPPAAILVINDRPWALAEGETAPNGWTALKITDKEITLRSPEGNTLVFLYEGERP
ncbi:MAG: hypothetical protein PHF93_00140 [Acidobacteriota bacterium]|nr:hypothetical protein [Acidobacteriota bacterium]HNQ80589.1 hypothetical protein [Candidatus Aminicenantes bacterium]MDD8032210.1 hypothetical protein [Acidobacteriota bacterium]HNT32182.1 hypothetical protein [Candidatus Aminicenantes bacterium]HOF83618.1 hypothetical protein [Candidatus Aminicenantes bacterium]